MYPPAHKGRTRNRLMKSQGRGHRWRANHLELSATNELTAAEGSHHLHCGRPLTLPAALTPDLLVGSRASDSSAWKCEAAPREVPGLGVTETGIPPPSLARARASCEPSRPSRLISGGGWSSRGGGWERPVASGHA